MTLVATLQNYVAVVGSRPATARIRVNDAKLRALPLDVLLNRYEGAVYWANEYPGNKQCALRKLAYRREVERRITPLADRELLPPRNHQ